MKNELYIVNVLDWNHYETVVVSIHETKEGAKAAKEKYETNCKGTNQYEIVGVTWEDGVDKIYDSCKRDDIVFPED